MNTIAQKITYLNETKQLLKQSLNDLGAKITDEDTFRSYAQKINDIYENWPKVSEKNTNFTLNSTKEGKMKIGLKGNTSQESTTGKNLFNGSVYNESEPYYYSDNLISNNEVMVMSFKDKDTSIDTSGCYFGFVDKYNGSTTASQFHWVISNGNIDSDRTNRHGSSNVYCRQWFVYPKTALATLLQRYDIQIEKGSISTDYEPYTGGNPAPNPDYPYPVNVVTGDNSIKVGNKNLFDKTSNIVLNKYIGGDGTIQNEALNWYQEDYIEVKPSTNYIMSSNSSQTVRIVLYDENKTFISRVYSTGSIQATTTATTKYIRLSGYNNVNNNIMLNEGTTALPYEPYQSQTYPINLGSIELCKIGDYQDYIYKENGKWYKKGYVRHISLAIADMDNNENYPGWKNVRDLLNDYPYKNTLLSNFTDYMCNITNKNNVISANTTDLAGDGILFFNKWAIALTQTQWKEQYPNLVVELYYALATPTITPITDTTLIEQLDNLEKAYSYDTQTNISQDNDDLPFILDVTALKKNSSN